MTFLERPLPKHDLTQNSEQRITGKKICEKNRASGRHILRNVIKFLLRKKKKKNAADDD